MKQNTLFSFFSNKKNKPPGGTGGANKDKKKSASPSSFSSTYNKKKKTSSSSCSSSSPTSSHSQPPRSSSSPSSCKNPIDIDAIHVGTRLAVYWPDDDEYYPARVTSVHRGRHGYDNQVVHKVLYDDGEVEELDLTGETFKVLDDDKKKKKRKKMEEERGTMKNENERIEDEDISKRKRKRAADDEVNERQNSSPPGVTVTGTKKRRCIVEMEGGETDEYEFQDDDDDAVSSSSYSDGDESDYEEKDDDGEDDEEEEFDELQDSDSDNDKKKSKRVKGNKTKNRDSSLSREKRQRLVKVTPTSSSSSSSRAISNPYKKRATIIIDDDGNKSKSSSATSEAATATSSGSDGKAVTPISMSSFAAGPSDSSSTSSSAAKSQKSASSLLSSAVGVTQSQESLSACGDDNTDGTRRTLANGRDFRTPTPPRRGGKTKTPSSSALSSSSSKKKGGGGVVTPATTATATPRPVTATSPPPADGGTPATGKWEDGAVNPAGTHVHNHLKFLHPPYLRDADGNLSTSNEYDPRTLLFTKAQESEIEKLTKGKLTPASKQWWEIKSRYFDTVLFFKTGKFYELYHMDADVGCKELGFVYMKGRDAHSGFPEGAYGLMSGRLVNKGYKVARVEQTETPDQLALRKKKAAKGKKPQVINREVCSISTIGTKTYCFLDDTRCFRDSNDTVKSGAKGGGEAGAGAGAGGRGTKGEEGTLTNIVGSSGSEGHGPLLAIREILVDEDPRPSSTLKSTTTGDDIGGASSEPQPPRAVCEYGIVVVDAARSVITMGQFADDALRSRLHTLLTTFSPSEILIEQQQQQQRGNGCGGGDKIDFHFDEKDRNGMSGGGGGGASNDLIKMIKSTQTARIEIIRNTETFPPSTAVERADRLAVQRPNPKCHPWNVNEFVSEIRRKGYYKTRLRSKKKKKTTTDDDAISSEEKWPEVLKACVDGGANLALSAFGAVLFYLQRALVDREILAYGNVRAYVPPGSPIVDDDDDDDDDEQNEDEERGHEKKCSGGGRGNGDCPLSHRSEEMGYNGDESAKCQSGRTSLSLVKKEDNNTGMNLLKKFSAVSAAQEDGIEVAAAVVASSSFPAPSSPPDDDTSPVDAQEVAASLQEQQQEQQHGQVHHHNEEQEKQQRVPTVDTTDHLQLDGTTISNLELLVNQSDQSPRNSLWAKINRAKSPGGTRLLRAWLLRPLFRKCDIERRADAVAELSCGGAALAMAEARPLLSKVGDVDRLLSRVHSMGGGGGDAAGGDDGNGVGSHPNDRAVLYEGVQYAKRKVEDFRKLVLGLEYCGRVMDVFENECDVQSGLLSKVARRQSRGGCFPDKLEEELNWFRENFDCEKAKQGLYEPTRGMDEDYDVACDEVERIKCDLEQYKKEMSNVLGVVNNTTWKYINTKPESRDKYLIELPVNVRVPADFYVKGKRGSGAKQVNKYRTAVVEELVQALEVALEEQKAGKERGMRVVFAKFDSRRSLWAAAAQATSMLDALGALADVSSQPDYCRPEILDSTLSENFKPQITILQGRHPCVDVTHNGGDFIPNDLSLGVGGGSEDGDDSRVLLLSGPNMGGKSTLLRQTCLIAILAQMGCYVPASHCSLTPLDRIFTRLGATDRILSGQSTFYVELAETASALRGATCRSLVIMDELGRGTSTFDGTAIASATVRHLVEKSRCLVLFATHYHSLLEDYGNERGVRLGHMECLVEGEEDDSGGGGGGGENKDSSSSSSDQNITFLYTLGEGSCPRSFGINVARLAGLPQEVLSIAKQKSAAFEDEMKQNNVGEETGGAITASSASTTSTLLDKLRAAVDQEDVEEAESLWRCLVTQEEV